MAFGIREIEDMALQARLSLTEEEKKKYAEQIGIILDYAEKLNHLDTDQVEPLVYILPIYNVFREDEVDKSTPREEILAQAPLIEEGQYKVPKIM
ncbi:Asp-tRNA(Asn)/Glu-tRNA(Gln) amidotransferase subunit GatC [Syntrophomonas erecta]